LGLHYPDKMASRRPPGKLPAELSSFVGRRREVLEGRQLLMRSRLVTLTGPGGVGKTRLALQIAKTFSRSLHDGVWLAELASVSQAGNAAEAIAGTLRVPEQSGRAPEDALAAFVSNRELLLLVDNCEHVLETCSDLWKACSAPHLDCMCSPPAVRSSAYPASWSTP